MVGVWWFFCYFGVGFFVFSPIRPNAAKFIKELRFLSTVVKSMISLWPYPSTYIKKLGLSLKIIEPFKLEITFEIIDSSCNHILPCNKPNIAISSEI